MSDLPWRIQLLGGLSAARGDQIVTRFHTQKAAALLAYLAYHRERAHPRDVLIEVLWPGAELEAGRHRLSVALSSLRQQLEPARPADPAPSSPGAVILADRFSVRLDPAAVTTDVAELEAALTVAAEARDVPERVQALVTAVELYHGELLPGYYEEWILAEQQRLRVLFLQSLQQLMAHFQQAGATDQALQYALRMVSADPLREESHQGLIRLYAAAGQPAAALRQYRELERILQQELNEAPSEATRLLVEEIRRSGEPDHRRPTTDHRPPAAAHHSSLITHHSAPSPPHPFTPSAPLEPVGGAVPLDSPFYIERDADREFAAAMARRDSIVLVKGAQQVGKTSLLARGVQQARQAGARVALTDLEKLNAEDLESADALLLALAQRIADELDLDVSPADRWTPVRGPNANFERFLERDVLGALSAPIVWVLDEVDRLFSRPFGSEIFGLFRSWHNERALDPGSPWFRFTLAIAYATEAHLFITDLNKSPFNVGTRLTLEDFTQEQVAELNRRSGSPLQDAAEVARYYHLVGGHPYLVRRGLYEMAAHGIPIATLESQAESDEWIFGDHLRRMLAALTRDADLCEAVGAVLRGLPCPSPESFYRLRSAGLITGDSAQNARPRCQLYAGYLAKRLDVR